MVLQHQADGLCPALNLSKLAAFFVVTDVCQDGPFTIVRRIADAIVTELIVSRVDIVLRVTQDITSPTLLAFYE